MLNPKEYRRIWKWAINLNQSQKKQKKIGKRTSFIEKEKDARSQKNELNSENENIYSEGRKFTANEDAEFGEALNADDVEVNPNGPKIDATETIIIEFPENETSVNNPDLIVKYEQNGQEENDGAAEFSNGNTNSNIKNIKSNIMNKNKSEADLQEEIKKGKEQIDKVPPIEDLEDIVDKSNLSDKQKRKIDEDADTATNEIKHPAS